MLDREALIERLKTRLIPREDLNQYEDEVWNCAVWDCIELVKRMEDE